MLTVSTRDGAVYSVEYRGRDSTGSVLAVRWCGGGAAGDPQQSMQVDRWYRVSVLVPQPPMIGDPVSMVLDADDGSTEPIVRRTDIVMSVVGVL